MHRTLSGLATRKILLAALATSVMLFTILMGLYIRNLHNVVYIVDDFGYARRVSEYGLLGAQYSWYANPLESFTGRIGSTALISLTHMFGPTYTGRLLVLLSLIALASLIIATYILISRWSVSVSRSSVLIASASLVITTYVANIILSPAPYQTTLWAPGVLIYFLPLYMLATGFALLHANLKSPAHSRGNILGYLGQAIIFLAALSSEVTAIIGLAFLGILLGSGCLLSDYHSPVMKLTFGKMKRSYVYTTGLLAVAFFIQYLAPGTQRRITYLNSSESIQESLKASLHAISGYFSVNGVEYWNVMVILFTTGLCAGLIITRKTPYRHSSFDLMLLRKFFLLLSYLAAIGLLVSIVALFPSHYSTGDIPDRTLMPLSFLLAATPLVLGLFSAYLIPIKNQRILLIIAGTLVSLSIVGAINFKSQYHIVTQNILNYRMAFFARDKEIRDKLQSGRDVPVETNLPDIYLLTELSSDRTNWLNTDVAKYYNARTIWSSNGR